MIKLSAKRILFTTIGLTLLFIVCWGLKSVSTEKSIDNATIQLSKIDFASQLPETEVIQIVNTLKSVDGVKSVNYFEQQSTLVTSYDNRKLDGDKVLQFVSSITLCDAIPAMSNQENVSNGCPFHSREAMSSMLKNLVKSIFN